MADQVEVSRADAAWLRQRERGSSTAIAAMVAVCRVLGRTGARALLHPIALYYTVFGGAAIRASRHYLRLVLGTASFSMVYRHILTFTQTILDRLFFAQGRYEHFEITRNGKENLDRLTRERRGAILLGAHLGSFDAMRAMSKDESQRLNILVHFENARKISAFLKRVAPDYMDRVIEIRPGDPSFIFKVKEKVDAGELIAILGDRTGLGEKSMAVPFFGRLARFPTGALSLASVLKCPVYLTFGLHHAPNRYDLYCEPFAERIDLPRKTRRDALRGYLATYAERLEDYVRRGPYNWFNFYDFWKDGDDD